MTISVVLATFNGATFLSEQLQSLARQIRLPDELVVSDDCSTDDTLEIIERFAQEAPFPVHVSVGPSRVGFRANFLRATQSCSGDLISFCDQDDYWFPDKLAVIAEVFDRERDVLAVFHNAQVTDAARRPIGLFYATPPSPVVAPPISLVPFFYPQGFTQVLRSSLLKALPLWHLSKGWFDREHRAAHDEYFFALASSLGRVGYVHRPLADYRQHGANLYGAHLLRQRPPSPRLADKRDLLTHLSEVCAGYHEVIQVLSEAGPTEWSGNQLAEACRSWGDLSAVFSRRAAVRGERGMATRARAFLELLYVRGAYSEKGLWTFGRRSAAEDIVWGILFKSIVARFGAPVEREGALRRGVLSTSGYAR